MDNYMVDGDDQDSSKKVLEQEGLESSEEGFMRGYSEDDSVEECSECGSAIDEDEKVEKAIDGDLQNFCSKDCCMEFEENM